MTLFDDLFEVLGEAGAEVGMTDYEIEAGPAWIDPVRSGDAWIMTAEGWRPLHKGTA